MYVAANGIRMWFDVDGAGLVPEGPTMRERPTLVLLHGGPGTYDHSYFKPAFESLTTVAQVVYLDLRGHGRTDWGKPEEWSFESCADDVRAFCDALGISSPIVLGHSLGGFVALVYAVRYPEHPAGLVLLSTSARFDIELLVDGVRRVGGDGAAETAARVYGGDLDVAPEEWMRVFSCFGPNVPTQDEQARKVVNPALREHGFALMTSFDVLDDLSAIRCPTLVAVGELDPVTPPASAREIVDTIYPGLATLDVIPAAGHFPWKDAPERTMSSVGELVMTASSRRP